MLSPRLLALALCTATLLATATASAQGTGGTTGTGTGTSWAADDIYLTVRENPAANLTDYEIARFFDIKHCECGTPVTIYVSLQGNGFIKRRTTSPIGNLELWVGTDCTNTAVRLAQCKQLTSVMLGQFFSTGRTFYSTDAKLISTYGRGGTNPDGVALPGFSTPNCISSGSQFNQGIFALMDVGGDGIYELTKQTQVLVDLDPPPPPDPETTYVSGGNQALLVDWTPLNASLVPDILGYQILCSRGDSLQVFNDGTFAPGFETCTTSRSVAGLDPLYACSPLLSISTASYRVKILQNEIWYGAAVVAIDKHGNPSPADVFYGQPTKTKSFYDLYREDPDHQGEATGGFCTLSPGVTAPTAALAALAAVALAVVITQLRRRRRR